MSVELATKLYQSIGAVKHLRTFEFLKAIQENTDADGYARITYAKWRDEFGIHAFILNECTDECETLGFIAVARENKNGIAAEGGKGSKRIYKLTLDMVKPVSEPKVEVKTESSTIPISKSTPEKKIEDLTSAIKPITLSKGKKMPQPKAKPTASKPVIKPSPAKKTGESASGSGALAQLPVKYRNGMPVRKGISIQKKKVGEFTKVPVPTSKKKTAKATKK